MAMRPRSPVVVDELSGRLAVEDLGALWVKGSRGLTDWSRTVIDALLGKDATLSCAIRGDGGDAYRGRVAGGGLGVLRGRRGLDGHCDRARGSGHHGGSGWVWRSPGTFPVYGHDRRVCDCVTNCVTITTDDHGLWWTLGDA